MQPCIAKPLHLLKRRPSLQAASTHPRQRPNLAVRFRDSPNKTEQHRTREPETDRKNLKKAEKFSSRSSAYCWRSSRFRAKKKTWLKTRNRLDLLTPENLHIAPASIDPT